MYTGFKLPSGSKFHNLINCLGPKPNSEQNFKIFHQNIESLSSRIEPLQIILNEIRPDIVILSEHNMKPYQIERLNITNFTVSSYYSRKSTTKGGVMILARGGLVGRQLEMPAFDLMCQDKMFEFCASVFVINGLKYLIIAVYRSPASIVSCFLDRLCNLIDLVSKKFKNIIIGGDININILNNNANKIDLQNVLESHNMIYLVDFPTRVDGTSVSGIDNFFTNLSKDCIRVSGVVTMLSDHDGQVLEILNVNKLKENSFVIKNQRDFSEENIKLFKKLLENENWQQVYLASSEEKYKIFNQIFLYYFNWSFPKKSFKVKKNCGFKWINNQLKEEKQNIIQLTKTARYKNDINLINYIKKKNKDYKKHLIQTKKEFFDEKIKKSNNVMKTSWKIINSEISNKKGKNNRNFTLKMDSEVVRDPCLVSNVFNNYFINIANTKHNRVSVDKYDDMFHHSKLSKDNESSIENNTNYLMIEKRFELSPTSVAEVQAAIDTFGNKFSCGYDEVPIKLIKEAKNELSSVLVHVINSSFVSGKFPDLLKISKVVPIYKSSDPELVSNYRPISLLSSISKVFEKIVCNRLVNFLEENNILDDTQHGFRKGKSTISAAVNFIESVIDSLDEGDLAVGIFMDLSKAFDSVNHQLLLSILQKIGIKNNALDWFSSYLLNRKQFVEIQYLKDSKFVLNYKSSLQNIKLGVPQGSNLGPLLFLCYLNNIGNCLKLTRKNNLFLYADDASLKLSNKILDVLEINAAVEMASLKQSLEQRNLQLNFKKTKFIHFKTKQNKNKLHSNIIVEDNEVEQVNTIKFLGLKVDSNLSWDNHINKLLNKINSGLYALKKMSFLCSIESLKQIYFCHIHSHISYGVSLYGATKTENLNRILKVQKKAIRSMLRLNFSDSVKQNFKELGIMTVFGLYVYHSILIFMNDKSKITNEALNTHSYNTRKKQDIVVEHHRLQIFEKKPHYVGKRFYKNVPVKIKEEKNDNRFKNRLKDYIIHLAPYSLSEFGSTVGLENKVY